MPPEPERAYPSELPVVPLRQTVVFPLTLQPLAINRPLSIESVNRALAGDRLLFLTLPRNDNDEPEPGDLHRIGTVAAIRQMAKVPNGGVHVIVEGVMRGNADQITRSGGALRATVSAAPDSFVRTIEIDAYVRRLHELIDRALSLSTGLSQELRGLVAGIDDPLRLAYLLSSLLDMKAEEKQQILEQTELTVKLQSVSNALGREIALLEMKSKIETAAQQEMTDAQRQYYLRQQLKAIQDELGEGEKTEVQELRTRLTAAKLPEPVGKVAEREVERLERMTPASPEYQMIRTYFDWVLDVPWSTTTEDRLDPVAARQVLDQDHYDLDKVKERIVEYLAVHKLKTRQAASATEPVQIKGPILCFVGPPGVGKTSLGQSIARAMNRKFVRISLGGVRDEAEIRGHRRTYIGAIPGRIVQALKQAGAMNPVFMLDEIDKIAAGGFQGDPAAALLEVLDPAQNHAFRDHYLDVELDLSQVLFIATANVADTIPGPLFDRMEVIRFDGYTTDEKVAIARRHLWPRQVERNGLRADEVTVDDAVVRLIVSDYTREAGVRQLERELGTVLRRAATTIASAPESGATVIDVDAVREALGRPKVFHEAAVRTSVPGVATGLAVTGVGGDVLFVEAASMPGKGGLVLTGQLGEVMKESARIALTYVKSHASELRIDEHAFEGRDVHVHVPAGAIPKDGPSAGITMVTAIASLLTRRPVRSTVGMTGEVTLQGRVLPIGGLKQKVLAAQAAGLTEVIVPERNLPDLDDIPSDVRDRMRFHSVETVDQVLGLALEPVDLAMAA